jgi:hypothetical protein
VKGSATSPSSLADTLESVDAVITTPSTVMLESMLQGVPVALLDYNNRPHYVPAAWTITAPDHMGEVIAQLVAPPHIRMIWQDTILHDNLECRSAATPRLAQLVQQMIAIVRQCRVNGEPVSFPGRILSDVFAGHHLPEERFDLARLYPDHPVFSQMDRAELQAALGHSRSQMDDLRQELADAHHAQRYYRKYTLVGRLLKLKKILRG